MTRKTEFVRKRYRDGNLLPEAYNWLKSIPENCLYHVQHGMKHPLSRYSNSLTKIAKNYLKVLDEVDNINSVSISQDNLLKYDWERFTDAQASLLYSLNSHTDSCYDILKSIHKPVTSVNENFSDRWLKAVKHLTFTAFKSYISDYKDSLGKIVNKIKHEDAPMRSIVIFPKNNSSILEPGKAGIIYPRKVRIVGYYIEGMQSDNTIGPHPEVHPNNDAISINYDLRYHFGNLYRISKPLRAAVTKGIKNLQGIDLPHPPKVDDPPIKKDWLEVIKRVSNLPKLFFENEFNKKAAEITFRNQGNSSQLTIVTPGTKTNPWEGDCIRQTNARVDASTLSYRPPYGI